MSLLSVASGLVMIGLYSWRLNQVTKHYTNYQCSLNTLTVQYDYCKSRKLLLICTAHDVSCNLKITHYAGGQVTVAALFIVDGIVAVIVNSIIFPLADKSGFY